MLTPHAGELGRLLELDSAEIERERLRHVREAAERSGAVVVLKGDDTLIAEPSGRVAVSPGGSPALATAGTGDVLTGVIAALLAQGLDAVRRGGGRRPGCTPRPGARRRAAVGAPEGVIATDVIEALPAARGRGERARRSMPMAEAASSAQIAEEGRAVERVQARVNVAAIERNCARLRARAARTARPVRGREGRRLRPRRRAERARGARRRRELAGRRRGAGSCASCAKRACGTRRSS